LIKQWIVIGQGAYVSKRCALSFQLSISAICRSVRVAASSGTSTSATSFVRVSSGRPGSEAFVVVSTFPFSVLHHPSRRRLDTHLLSQALFHCIPQSVTVPSFTLSVRGNPRICPAWPTMASQAATTTMP